MYSRYLSSYTRPTYTAPKVYPQDIECIIQPIENKGGIYVSNVQAAQNLNTLKRFNIKAILTAANGIRHSHSKQEIHSIKYIPADDHQSFDLSKYFDQSVEWIGENLKTYNILIHCMAGVSRSVSLLLAYLIKQKNMKYNDAYDLVKRKRRIIHPNSGFIKQLRQYELKHKKASVEKQRLERIPSPRQNREPSPRVEPKTPTPNLIRNTEYRPYSDYKASPYSASKVYKSNIYQRSPSPSNHPNPNRMTEMDLDQRIQQIRKKYSNKSEYIPSKHVRQHSSYKQRLNDPLFDRDTRLSKYFATDYKTGYRFSDRIKNPQVYGGSRLFNNFLYNGRY